MDDFMNILWARVNKHVKPEDNHRQHTERVQIMPTKSGCGWRVFRAMSEETK